MKERTAYRDITRDAAPPARYRALVQRLFGRGRRPVLARVADRIVRRVPRMTGRWTVRHGWSLNVSLAPTLHGRGPSPATVRAFPAWRIVEPVTIVRERRAHLVTMHRTRVLERVIVMRQAAAAAPTQAIVRSVAAPAFPPVAMRVVRATPPPGPAAALPSSAQREHGRSDAGRVAVTMRTAAGDAAAMALAPPELARVTDHVIRQLDRRIVSYRERTGRF